MNAGCGKADVVSDDYARRGMQRAPKFAEKTQEGVREILSAGHNMITVAAAVGMHVEPLKDMVKPQCEDCRE